MSKSITEQIEDLQKENEHLKKLQKSFEKTVKLWYGTDAAVIQKKLNDTERPSSSFEKKIISYFGLKTQQDFTDFVAIFCTKNSLDYFKKSREKSTSEDAR